MGENTLESAERSLRFGTAVLDDEGRVVEASDGFRALLGTDRAILGAPLIDLLAQAEREAFDRLLAAVVSGRPEASFWVSGDRENGVGPLEVRLQRPRDPGRPLTAVLVDRSEREGIERQLAQSDRFRILGEMLMESVHELNNLLSVILNATAPASRVDAESIELVQRAADDARRLTDSLQHFGQVTNPATDFEVFDPADVVREAIDFTRFRWQQLASADAHIELETALESLSMVRGEPMALRHVVVNLITNAVDAMPGGGRLLVTCKREGDDIAIRVSDTGAGIDDAVGSRVLDPYVSTKSERGSGLGLSIVSDTVARHGGSLSIDSSEGGTTVEVRLACLDSRPTEQESAANAPAPGRILLIEGREEVRRLMAASLRGDGHAVLEAGSAEEAARRIDGEETPSLIVCDLDLERGSGLDLVAQIQESGRRIPTLLMSGWGLDLRLDSLRDSIHVIHKPVRMSTLRRAVVAAQAAGEA